MPDTKKLKLGLPGGSLQEPTLALMERAGFTIQGVARSYRPAVDDEELEIRILRAVVSFQQRNLLGYQYSIVPGFEMPRVLAIYGVRWEFWN